MIAVRKKSKIADQNPWIKKKGPEQKFEPVLLLLFLLPILESLTVLIFEISEKDHGNINRYPHSKASEGEK